MVTGLTLHVGNQAEAAVILEFIRMIKTCFHRHSHQKLLKIQTVTLRAGQYASFAQAKGKLLYLSTEVVTNVHDEPMN
jgi:hypothetical protein